MDGVQVRYSEAFKHQVVSDLESGKLCSIEEARKRYGIGGGETVQRWIRKYGKNHLLGKVVHVQTPREKDRLRELKKENDELKRALADAHMKAVLYESWLEAACEEFGVSDIDAFKKKLAGPR
jgi:transposase-like protein